MTRDRDLIGLVQGYLDDVESFAPLPDATRQAIRARLPSIPQRPAWWPGWRYLDMNSTIRVALGAAAVLVLAIAGFAVLGGPASVGFDGSDDVPSAAPSTPQPSPTPVPRLPNGEIAETATYRANAFIPVEVLVTVPEGWFGGGDWLLLGPRGFDAPDGMNIRFGSVTTMYVNPLDARDGMFEPGPSVDDLVEAMTSHPDWPTSQPTDVTIDGYDGKAVRLTLPADLDGDEFLLFRDGHAGNRWAFAAGQIVDFYIIDVEGQRLVLELFSYPDTPAADLAARQDVVESMQLSLSR